MAIQREKEIKNLSREKKLYLIREFNPKLEFLKDYFKWPLPFKALVYTQFVTPKESD